METSSHDEGKGMTAEYQTATPPELEGWTKNEKFDLNLGLKHHGFNIPEIKKNIPGKTEEQIQTAIDYFKAELKRRGSSRQKRRMKYQPQVPLAKWADLITSSFEYKDLRTDCPAAIRIIADFEKFPDPSHTNNVDFKRIYNYIADAMQGIPLPPDHIVADVFNHCIMDASGLSKALVPINQLRAILKIPNDQYCNTNIPKATSVDVLAALRELITQINYNPLNIPEAFLKYPIPEYVSEY